MKTLRFEVELVTPMFMSGADPRGAPELRAPSLRGAMRFWLRALLARPDSELLYREEASLFGSQKRGSPLVVRVSCQQEPHIQTWHPGQWPPGSGGGTRREVNGLAYLGFAFRGRQGIDVGWRFTVELGSQDRDNPREPLRKAWACWWTLCRFGGLGSRTRRGFGTIRVVRVEGAGDLGPDLPSMTIRACTPSELVKELSEGLEQATRILQAGPVNQVPPYTTLRKGTARAWVLQQVWNRWHEALRDVGRELALARKTMQPTLATVRQGGNPGIRLERPAFGLPIVYYDPGTKDSLTLEGVRGQGESKEAIHRRASPFIIRPLKLATGGIAVLLLKSLAPFWPAGTRLQIRDDGEVTGSLTTEGLDRFIRHCLQRWDGEEVTLP